MFITPSGIPAQVLKHGMIACMSCDCGDGHREGRLKRSAGWRVSRDPLRARPEFGAVVHTHAPFPAIPATARKPVPAIHCMMAAFGGPKMQVADCACYGIADVVTAMKGADRRLMANRRMLTAWQTLARAAWLAHGLEVLAHRCLHALRIGSGHVLTKARPAGAHAGFASHSLQHQRRRAPWRPRSPARARDAGPVAQSSRSADGPSPRTDPSCPMRVGGVGTADAAPDVIVDVIDRARWSFCDAALT